MAGSLVVLARQSPLNGGTTVPGAQLFVYDATLTTKRAIFTTSALSVQHSNPLAADANGRFAAVWINPAGGAYKIVLAPSGDTDPPASPFWTEDNIPTEIEDVALSANVPLKDASTNAFTGVATYTTAGDQNHITVTAATVVSFYGSGTSAARLGTSSNHAYNFYTNNTLRGAISETGVWTMNGNSAATIIESSFTGTLTGMTGATTGSVNYRIVANSAGTGKLCTLYATSSISGTSNTTAMTMTGLPAACTPSIAVRAICETIDNAGSVITLGIISGSATTITFYVDQPFSATGYTNSGAKGLDAGWLFSYPL